MYAQATLLGKRMPTEIAVEERTEDTAAPIDTDPPRPRRLIRWLFWLIVSAFSVFFAEVVSGSQPLAFMQFPGTPMMMLIYGIHALVLASIVWRRDRVDFASLVFAGVVFGLYEAYITKVIWTPLSSENPIVVGGFNILTALMLVFVWHPFMAFIVPLFAVERCMLSSSDMLAACGPRWRRWLANWPVLVIFAAAMGLFHGTIMPSFAVAAGSAVGCSLVLLALVWLWTGPVGGGSLTMRELLPRGIEWIVLAMLLLAQYVLYGLVWRSDKLPGLGPQAVVWGAYVLFIALLGMAVTRRPVPSTRVAVPRRRPSVTTWLVFAAVFAGTSLLVHVPLHSLRHAAYVCIYLTGIPLGVIAFLLLAFRQIRDVFAGDRNGRSPAAGQTPA